VRPPLGLLRKAEPVVAFAVLLGLVVALQVAGGAYASGFGGYPDEPAHVVTSSVLRSGVTVLLTVLPFLIRFWLILNALMYDVQFAQKTSHELLVKIRRRFPATQRALR
jgi:hypothetical protein